MNKNRFKAILLSVAVALFAFSTFLAPLAEAIQDPGVSTATKYLEVPLTFTRENPTMVKADGCDTVINIGTEKVECVDVAAGIGVYNYVGEHTPDRSNFSAVVAIDEQTGDVSNPSFGLVGGKLRIYDLTIGRSYKIYVIFDDKNSADIKKLLGQVAEFCKPGSDGVISADEKVARDLKVGLVDACSRYNAEPFLPAAINPAWLNGQQPIAYSKAIMSLSPLSLTAAVPTGTTRAGGTTDDCPIDTADDFRWLACPAYKAGRTAAEGMDRAIQNFLFTPTDQIFTAQMKTAWSSFRTIGVILILLAGLVMVISQALGFELFDAYTVKKLLPRLLVAAIGITLSWPILLFIVSFFNDIGGWTHDLILAPFGSMDPLYTGGSTAAIIGLLVGVAIKGGVIALGAGGLISLLGTMMLALLIGMVVLAVRQAVILMAVLLAPLAIAAYILPGTQKLWEFWKGALLTSLFMFPIIMAFIASGKALAFVLGSMPGATTMHLLAVMVYFAPYFLLPFAFKLAGGLMATVFSIANDRSRGIFDSRREKRKGIRDDRLKRAENNSLWDKNSRIGRRANTMAGWVVDPKGNLQVAGAQHNVPGLRKSGNKILSHIQADTVKQTGEAMKELNDVFGSNDAGYRATGGMYEGMGPATQDKLERAGFFRADRDDSGNLVRDMDGNLQNVTKRHAPHTIKEFEDMANILRTSDKASERIAATSIDGSKGRLATLYSDQEMMKANVEGASLMGLAAHGFANPNDVANVGNIIKAKSGTATAQSITSQAQLYGQKGRPDLKNGYGKLVTQSGDFINGIDDGGRALDLIGSLSQQDVAGAKAAFMKDMEPYYEEILNPPTGQAAAVQAAMASDFNRLDENAKKTFALRQPNEYKQHLRASQAAARAPKAAAMREATIDQLAQWIGPYSGASTDVKVAAQEWARKFNIEGEVTRRSRYVDPSDPTGANRGGGDPGPQPGGGTP